MQSLSFGLGLWLLVLALPLAAVESKVDPSSKSTEKQNQPEKLERIGGTYRIVRLNKLGDADFQIHFESVPLTGRFDRLVLRSDHVHMSIQEGQVLRLSAEVLSSEKPEVEVTQVLLFLSHSDYGTTPVWLLSSQHVTKDFRGSRWLDMHAPQADFQIL